MTRQRWSGKGGPFPPRKDRLNRASSLGTKQQCTLRCCITSTIPCQATSPPTPAHPSPPWLVLWFLAKANRKLLAATALVPMVTLQSAGLDNLDLQRGDKEADSMSAARFACKQSFRLDTRPQCTRKKYARIHTRLITANQARDINTSCHWKRLGEQRGQLLKVDWSFREVMSDFRGLINYAHWWQIMLCLPRKYC